MRLDLRVEAGVLARGVHASVAANRAELHEVRAARSDGCVDESLLRRDLALEVATRQEGCLDALEQASQARLVGYIALHELHVLQRLEWGALLIGTRTGESFDLDAHLRQLVHRCRTDISRGACHDHATSHRRGSPTVSSRVGATLLLRVADCKNLQRLWDI